MVGPLVVLSTDLYLMDTMDTSIKLHVYTAFHFDRACSLLCMIYLLTKQIT
jgi:hypothetical protein